MKLVKDKEDVVYIHNGVLLSHKKEWDSTICNNMNGPGDYHTNWSKPKTNVWYHLYVESKKKWYKWTYLQNRNRETENKLMVTKGERGGWID